MPELLIFLSTESVIDNNSSEKLSLINGIMALGHLGKAGDRERELACASFSTATQMLTVSLESVRLDIFPFKSNALKQENSIFTWERLVQWKGLLLAEKKNSISPFSDIALSIFSRGNGENAAEKDILINFIYPLIVEQVEAGRWFHLPMNDGKFSKNRMNNQLNEKGEMVDFSPFNETNSWPEWIIKALFSKNTSLHRSILSGYLWIIQKLAQKYPDEIELYYCNKSGSH